MLRAGLATQAAGATLSLRNVPGDVAATAGTDDRLARLPVGSVPLRVYADNNGTTIAGGTNFDVGYAAFDTTDDTLLDAVLLASLNSGAGRIMYDNTAAGIAQNTVGANNYLTVTVNATPNTTGDLRVIVHYLEYTNV